MTPAMMIAVMILGFLTIPSGFGKKGQVGIFDWGIHGNGCGSVHLSSCRNGETRVDLWFNGNLFGYILDLGGFLARVGDYIADSAHRRIKTYESPSLSHNYLL
jgi:hypothetical protein